MSSWQAVPLSPTWGRGTGIDGVSASVSALALPRLRPRLCPLWALALGLLLLGGSGGAIHMDVAQSHSTFTCEPIGLRMCQDLPYNTTFMPNLLNHYDQQTAALAMEVRGRVCVFLCVYTPANVCLWKWEACVWCVCVVCLHSC